jgi:phosphatidylglycerol:prolipoprotein diacylglycerol transferase
MCRIAFSLGPVDFYWYGIIIGSAVLAGIIIVLIQNRLLRQSMLPVFDLTLLSVAFSIVGARIYYVVSNWEIYRHHITDVLYLWHGGLSIYGALLGFVMAFLLYTRRYHLNFWQWADLFAPGLAIGMAIGQWANLINQEAFGYPTDLPWGIYIDFAYRPSGYQQFDFFQPVFLYESGWNLLLFFLLLVVSYLHLKRKSLQSGGVFLLYLLLFSIGHYFFEGLRLDSELVGGIRLAQAASVLTAIAAVILMFCRKTTAAVRCK